jgi:hypothetical protein
MAMANLSGLMTRLFVVVLSAVGFAVAFASPALSDTPPLPTASPLPIAPVNQTLISDHAFSGARGAIAINEAAGNGNVQVNAAAIGSGANRIRINQNTDASGHASGGAVIGAYAFAGSAGLLRINQTSGSGNAQSNSVLVRFDVAGETLSQGDLAAIITATKTSGTRSVSAGQQVSVAKTAFAGSSGIIQLNQSAGSGNNTANSLTVHIDTGLHL